MSKNTVVELTGRGNIRDELTDLIRAGGLVLISTSGHSRATASNSARIFLFSRGSILQVPSENPILKCSVSNQRTPFAEKGDKKSSMACVDSSLPKANPPRESTPILARSSASPAVYGQLMGSLGGLERSRRFWAWAVCVFPRSGQPSGTQCP